MNIQLRTVGLFSAGDPHSYCSFGYSVSVVKIAGEVTATEKHYVLQNVLVVQLEALTRRNGTANPSLKNIYGRARSAVGILKYLCSCWNGPHEATQGH